jgi:hypothetical protein
MLNKDRLRKEYIVLSAIMPDEINSYAEPFKNQVIEKINGVKIHGLADVLKAFKQTEEDFYEITFMGNNRILPLDSKKANQRHMSILEKYNIPAEARLETNQ